MKLSTKGRYGVRLMFDLALHDTDRPLPLREIASRQEISEKYLSNIIPSLRNAGLIHSVRGALGGYVLGRRPREITLKDILLALEGPMRLADCSENPEMCERAGDCLMREIWSEVSARMLDVFDEINLELMVHKQKLREQALSHGI